MGSLFAPPPLPPPPPSTFNAYSHFNASMAIIIVVLVSAFFIMGFFSVYVKRCASSEYEAQLAHLRDPARMATVTRAEIGLDKSVYEAFPLVSYSEARALKAANVTTECAVCLCEFEDEERLRMLPKCGHCFHPECIDAWFQNHTTCPLCRCSLAPALPEPGSEVTTGAFWSSGRFSFRSGSVHRTAPEEQPDGEAAGNGDVVVTIHDQDAIDLEHLRAFLRAGSVRGQSGRRVDGGSFRMPAEDSKGAAADTDVKTEEATRPGQEAARPGQAELKRTLSRNSLSFRQAVRGVELQNFLAGATSLSPKAASSGSPKGGAGAGGSPRGLVSANSLPSEGSPGSRMLRSTSVGRLGSSLRRSGSVGLLGGSMRLNKEDLGGEDLTLLEDSQEFASQSTTLERTSSDRQVVPDSPSQTQKDEKPKGL